MTGSSSVPIEDVPLMPMKYPNQFTPLIPIHFTNPVLFSQASHYAAPHVPSFSIPTGKYFVAPTSPIFFTPMSTSMPSQILSQMSSYVLICNYCLLC